LFLLASVFRGDHVFGVNPRAAGGRETAIIRRACISALVLGVILFFAGPLLFGAIGITLNSFRIGAGTLLFLTAISLVNNGTRSHATGLPDNSRDDIAVVPLAVPVMIGPATIGAILVYGAELKQVAAVAGGLLGLVSSLLILAVLLRLSGYLEKAMGKNGLNIMSKISGLILSAMAAEIVLTGLSGFITASGLVIS